MLIELFLEDEVENNVINFRDYADRVGYKSGHSYADSNAGRADCNVISLLERRH